MRGVLLLALCVKCISSLFIGDNGVLDALASQDNSELVAYGSDPDVDSESVAYGSDPEFTGTPVDEIQPLPTFSDSIFGATYLSLEGTQSPSLNFKVPGATDNENPSTLSSSAADDTSLSTWAYTGDRSSASTDLSSKVASSYLIAEPGDLNLFQLGAQGLAELAALLAYFAMELHERRFIGTPQRAPNEDFEPLKLPNYKTKRSQACPVDVYHLRDKPFCDQGLEWIKRTQVSSFDQTTYTLIKFKLSAGAKAEAGAGAGAAGEEAREAEEAEARAGAGAAGEEAGEAEEAEAAAATKGTLIVGLNLWDPLLRASLEAEAARIIVEDNGS
ncbi:hypothetical protein MMC07_005191 [Pseudocyphellaria aurata]|nr:hypothetical protein [Pseudocyphellaria aurata]